MKTQEQLQSEYNEQEKWFTDRVGKRIYRTKSTCKCKWCGVVYEQGLIIIDEFHASYLNDCSSQLALKYFDTENERDAYEKSINN